MSRLLFLVSLLKDHRNSLLVFEDYVRHELILSLAVCTGVVCCLCGVEPADCCLAQHRRGGGSGRAEGAAAAAERRLLPPGGSAGEPTERPAGSTGLSQHHAGGKAQS